MATLIEKINILLEAIKVLKNWYLYVLIYFKLLDKNYAVLETRNGIKIKIRTHSTDLMAFTHVWLLREYEKPGFQINSNDIVIDVGAHIGLFALFAAQFCKTGLIHCFEPIKKNFDMLVINLKINNVQNVRAYNIAVSHKIGTVTIFLNNDEAGHSMYVPSENSITVQSNSLKNIFDSNKIEKCNFAKIDCEGEEYEIINSLPTNYIEKIEKMCIEYHFVDTKPYLLDDLIKKLKELSYIVSTRSISHSIGFLYAKKILA